MNIYFVLKQQQQQLKNSYWIPENEMYNLICMETEINIYIS